MSTTLNIGLDVDNVIYPWATVTTRWVERRKGLPAGTLDDHALSWRWYADQWGMTGQEFGEHFTAGVQAGVIFAEGEPTEGSVAAVRRLHLAGHRIHYVTNREIPGVSHTHAWQVTHRWLHDHGFVVDSLTVSADKGEIRTDVFLDDSPENIEALMAVGHPYPMLWDRPHNRPMPSLDARRASIRPRRVVPLRIHDWHGFERAVETIAREHDRRAA